jgi:hypothetical protein
MFSAGSPERYASLLPELQALDHDAQVLRNVCSCFAKSRTLDSLDV